MKTGWLACLCLLVNALFMTYPYYQSVSCSSEGFSLRGPTHCFSVGLGYDSRFLFSIRSLGYEGQVDFEVSAPEGIEVDLKTPILLNSTEAGAYCPISVRATSKASYGNQSIQIVARGENYTASITICIAVIGLTTLTLQTYPIEIPVDIFLDNTRYHIESKPLVLKIRAGQHSVQLITNVSNVGLTSFASEGLNFTNANGITSYFRSSGPLTLGINDNSTVTILFRQRMLTTTETSNSKAVVRPDVNYLSIILLTVVILPVVAVYLWRKRTRS